ncbi:hypothetical protein [Burkholderia multivorans]
MELSRPSIGAIPRDVAWVAERLLRHYPGLVEIELTWRNRVDRRPLRRRVFSVLCERAGASLTV